MLLSIITINYNNAAGLLKTIESVANQQFQQFEFIIIDGNSTDGSIENIKKYENKINYWKSEPDNGIYDAMNKGILQSKGEYLLFLNSGDYLCDDLVLAKLFATPLKHDIIYGDIIWEDNGLLTQAAFPDVLSFGFFVWDALPHQGAVIKKSLLKKLGFYSEEYGISGDWVFFILAVCEFNCSYLHVPLAVSVCNRNGLSCQPENWNQIVANKDKLLGREFALFYQEYQSLRSQSDELKGLKASRFYKLYKKIKK